MARVFIKASAGRNRINVLGALNAITHQVTTVINDTYVNSDTVVSMLKKLRTEYSNDPVQIVLDNARYQHCKFVEQQAELLNIKLPFLPPYSPYLNIIERLWKFTKRQILIGTYYETTTEFHEAIKHFFRTVDPEFDTCCS